VGTVGDFVPVSDMLRATLTLLVSLTIAGQMAAQSPAKPPRSLDQQLLDDLDRDLLQNLPAVNKPGKPPAPPASGSKDDQKSGKATSESPGKPDHPLAAIAGEMRQVERRMADRDTSPATQQQQAAIIAQLDALLQHAQQAGQSGGEKKEGSGSAQAGTGTGNPVPGPPRDSSNRMERGTKLQPETADMKDLARRLWGHLPDKQREEMQASFSEQFLPKYERLIEEYYKRLAEERP
jgi:hypothetical protein